MEIVVTNQYGIIIFAVTVDEDGTPKTLYQGIKKDEAVSVYQKAIENPANAKKRVRFYNFRQVYDYVGIEKDKSAYPIKEFYDDTQVYKPSNKDNIETLKVNNNHKLLAPNGKISNLTAEQWHIVRTPEFMDWFGDWLRHPNGSSQVLDDNGEPMVMYHGTNNFEYFTNNNPNYTVLFDPRKSRLEPRTVGGGIYFSNKWDVAAQFSIFNFVVECFINIRKPIRIDGNHSHIWWIVGEDRINYGKNDGVIMYNTFDTLDGETENENYVSDIVIARYSIQVKLADGRNTTFDKNDVDIRYDEGGETDSSSIDENYGLAKNQSIKNLLAPNGKKSNLTPEQWHLVRTPAFKAWFGDWENNPQEASKVVDENGEPLVVGRCDKSRIYDFGKQYPRFFVPQRDVEGFGEFGDVETYAFLNIKNPIIVDYGGVWYNMPYDSLLRSEFSEKDLVNMINHEWSVSYNSLDEAIKDTEGGDPYLFSTDIISDYVKRNMPNYNGLIIKDIDETSNGDYNTDDYIVFNSTQIKLADGSNTTFDGSNPDIRYELGGIYHGSPYKFNKFSTAHMGTGEGLQAFGWGLYFTDSEGIAEFYANALSILTLKDENGNEIKISNELANLIKLVYHQYRRLDADFIKEKISITARTLGATWAKDAVKELNQIGYFELLPFRYKYRVTLHKGKTPDQYTWLEWDKPLSKQSEATKKALEKQFSLPSFDADFRTAADFYRARARKFDSDKKASEELLLLGIDGIKFPAESIARGATSDTARGFNYVVFDENAVTIENVEQFSEGGRFHLGGDMSKHLAPNGKPSNLTPEQWHLVRTPVFKAWFGDWENNPQEASKVVDANGEPLVVWHNQSVPFFEFKQMRIGKGFYFTSKYDYAEILNPQGNVKPFFLSIKNYYDHKNNIVGFVDKLKIGYDGERGDGHINQKPFMEIVAYYPTQIKLADGTNTTFDGSNPDIRYAEGGKTNLSRPYSSLDISRVKKGVVQLHSVHPKRITKIDDLPI